MNGEYNYLARCENDKEIGSNESYSQCPHCGKEFGTYKSFGNHIQEHKKNNTINWEFRDNG